MQKTFLSQKIWLKLSKYYKLKLNALCLRPEKNSNGQISWIKDGRRPYLSAIWNDIYVFRMRRLFDFEYLDYLEWVSINFFFSFFDYVPFLYSPRINKMIKPCDSIQRRLNDRHEILKYFTEQIKIDLCAVHVRDTSSVLFLSFFSIMRNPSLTVTKSKIQIS